MTKKWLLYSGLASLLLIPLGCSNHAETVNSSQSNKKEGIDQPVKLIVNTAVGMSDDDFDKLVVQPVQKKYPNISFEKAAKAEELIAAGTVPDLVFTSNAQINLSLDLGLGEDLSPMLKQYNIDLNRFEPEVVSSLKQIGKNGEIYGIPFDANVGLMLYNKDIFDKFAVPYPKDNMTWNEVIELARKTTRSDNGVQYIGTDPGTAQSMIRQYSLPVVDANQEKAVLQSEGYKNVFSIIKQLYDIPGYIGPKKEFKYGADTFFKDRRLAMLPGWIDGTSKPLIEMEKSGSAFNWDVVSYPAYDDRPGLSKQVDIHLFLVPPTSKNKEAAYRVLELLVSDEAQRAMNRSSTRLTVLKNPEIKKSYTEELGIFKGKNLEGLFKVKPALPPVNTVYDNKIYAVLSDAQKNIGQNGMDVNTALRTADEQANSIITEVKNANK
ncbi:ABC transporter substrate-binding protein [Paenibacillus sp. NPDC056579]|uniref:ABC transporter substrate-binding protein n=1 Tax=Paenibacillus sp. NPDC056579 TaxID=3345871 RepID=UPI0036C33431